MIHYVTSGGHTGPIRSYLGEWGEPVADLFRVHVYEQLPPPERVSGAVIFADVERAPPEFVRAGASLAAALPGSRILNSPARPMRRAELLRELHRSGVNSFRAFGLDEPWGDVRFPVFIRSSTEHTGPLSGLIRDRDSLVQEVARLALRTSTPLLVVEHVDVGDERGVYRKYSSFMAGGELIAHHVMFRTQWAVKGPSLDAPWMVDEERRYQEEDPHRAVIEDVFRMARVEYGRVDYGVKDGRVQVWEINTNPTVLFPRRAYSAGQMPAKEWFSARLNEALKKLA